MQLRYLFARAGITESYRKAISGDFEHGAARHAPIEALEQRIAPAAAVLNLGDLFGPNGFTLEGERAGDSTGSRVSGAGDVNGDGFADVLIGAEGLGDGPTGDLGGAYVVFGKAGGFDATIPLASLDGTNGFEIVNDRASGRLGFSVSSAGDFNGDGFDDMLIGAPTLSDTPELGIAYVIFGHASPFNATFLVSALDGSNGFRIEGKPGDFVAENVSTAGDFNGDGFDDILLGAHRLSDNGVSAGGAYLVFGTDVSMPAVFQVSTLDGTNGVQFNGKAAGDRTGDEVTGGADINGDGFGDIIIGTDPDPVSASGAAYVVFGQSSGFGAQFELSALDGSNGFQVNAQPISEDNVGLVIIGPNFDLNSDGFDDILMGEPRQGYIIFGKGSGFGPTFDVSSLDGANGFRFLPASKGEELAGASNAGDFNGDGISDIVVVTHNQTAGASVETVGYVVFGSNKGFAATFSAASIDGSNGFRITTPTNADREEVYPAAAGDVNNDGFGDLVFGSFTASPNGRESGAAFVVFGFDSRVTVKENRMAQFPDVDGDVITVTVSRGTITALDITLAPDGTFLMLDLTRENTAFSGANVSVNSKQVGGDGLVSLGAINASQLDLGKVKVDGVLGRITVGDGDPLSKALKSVVVRTLGSLDDPGDPLVSEITGSTKKFVVKGDVRNAAVDSRGRLNEVIVGGDLVGDGPLPLPLLVKLAEDGGIVGQAAGGIPTGAFVATSVGNFEVNGSVSGGSVVTSQDIGVMNVRRDIKNGAVMAEGAIKTINVFGNVIGDDPAAPVIISALARLDADSPRRAIGLETLSIKGDVQNAEILVGYNRTQAPKNADAGIGKVAVKGDWSASSIVAGIADVTADGFGRGDEPISETPEDAIFARIGSVIIKGTATGSPANDDHFAITAQAIGRVVINGVELPLSSEVPDEFLIDTANGDFRVVEV